MNTTRSYKEDLLKALTDPIEAQEYLNVALEDEDIEVFLLALQDVIEARNITSQSKKVMNKENIHQIFEKNSLQMNSIRMILNSLGFKLAVEQDIS